MLQLSKYGNIQIVRLVDEPAIEDSIVITCFEDLMPHICGAWLQQLCVDSRVLWKIVLQSYCKTLSSTYL
jgi:hypothetical protein